MTNLDEELLNSKKKFRCSWEELSDDHHYMKDNECITDGYRIGLSFKEATKSLFMFHNETVNVWTHLLGSIMSLLMLIGVYFHPVRDLQTGEIIDSNGYLDFEHTAIMIIFSFSAFICQFISSMYHLYGCLSAKCVFYFSKLDYLCINILIIGTAIPSYYYFFYHGNRFWFYLYLSLIICAALGVTVLVVVPKYSKPECRPLRSFAYSVFGVSAGFPSIQLILFSSMPFGLWIKLNIYLILGGLSYIFGAIIYGTRVPEKFYPGKFDYFFSSHQIFHCFVTLGVILHYIFLIKLLDYRISTGFSKISFPDGINGPYCLTDSF